MSRVKSYEIELVETTNIKSFKTENDKYIIFDMCNSLSKP